MLRALLVAVFLLLPAALQQSLAVMYGEQGLGMAGPSLQVRCYDGRRTGLCVVRAERDTVREVWAALTMLTRCDASYAGGAGGSASVSASGATASSLALSSSSSSSSSAQALVAFRVLYCAGSVRTLRPAAAELFSQALAAHRVQPAGAAAGGGASSGGAACGGVPMSDDDRLAVEAAFSEALTAAFEG